MQEILITYAQLSDLSCGKRTMCASLNRRDRGKKVLAVFGDEKIICVVTFRNIFPYLSVYSEAKSLRKGWWVRRYS